MKRRVRIIRGDIWAKRLKEHLSTPTTDTAFWMEEHTQILKSDLYTLSGLLRLDGEVCFLKLYRPKSLWQKILFFLRLGYPLRYSRMAQKLHAGGVAVPRPMASLRVPEGLLLLSQGLVNGGILGELWQQNPAEEEAHRMMRAAGETLANLHRLGYRHGDCTWDRLYWDGQKMYLFDLDYAGKLARRGAAKWPDVARFTVSAEELGIGPRRYEQFLESYLLIAEESRSKAIERMLPHVCHFRIQHQGAYGSLLQRLV